MHLNVDGTLTGDDERRVEGEFFEVVGRGCLEGEFEEGGSWHKSGTDDGVVGEPGVGA
ncbi:hypothetical protein Save01_09210 [Streptomyces avermitilis]